MADEIYEDLCIIGSDEEIDVEINEETFGDEDTFGTQSLQGIGI